jgi:hypothetical protein
MGFSSLGLHAVNSLCAQKNPAYCGRVEFLFAALGTVHAYKSLSLHVSATIDWFNQ